MSKVKVKVSWNVSKYKVKANVFMANVSSLPGRYLEVEIENAALVGRALWPGNGRLPVVVLPVQRHSLDTLGRVQSQRTLLVVQSALAPRILLDPDDRL